MATKPTCPHCASPFVRADQVTAGLYRCGTCHRPFTRPPYVDKRLVKKPKAPR